MICAPNNQAYYINRSEFTDQIMRIYLNGKDVCEEVIHSHKGRILQIQLAND